MESNSDEQLLKDVFRIRERLDKSNSSLKRLNNISSQRYLLVYSSSRPAYTRYCMIEYKCFQITLRKAESELLLLFFSQLQQSIRKQNVQDSIIMPPPLTMDDLGHNDSENLRPIDESVLRQWNLNASNLSDFSKHSFIIPRQSIDSKDEYENVSQRGSFSGSNIG